MPVNIFTTNDDPSASDVTSAHGINGSGQIVGVFRRSGILHGFVLSGGSFITIDDPLATGSDTSAQGINDSGQIVGDFFNASGNHGFLLSSGVFTTLDDPAATAALGQKIEAIGGIVSVRYSLVGRCAAIGLMQRIADLPILVLGCCELHSQKQAQLKVGAFEPQPSVYQN